VGPIFFDPRWRGRHGIGRFAAELQSRLPHVQALQIIGPKLSPIDPIAISLALRGKRKGCYFSPGFNPPLTSPIPVAFTIHDLIHLRVREESTPIRRLYYAAVVRPATHRAARILTVSQHSKRDIVEWSGITEEQVIVVGNGVSAAFLEAGPRRACVSPYFLHVGRRTSHKNVPTMLQAFARSRCAAEFRLLFTGTSDEVTRQHAASAGVLDRIEFIGELEDEALANAYRGASALVFPSLHEGFGLPIVEAMAVGTPVITSAGTATAEVAGDGNCLLIDPLCPESLCQAMERVAGDAQLREGLRARGLVRAQEFSWEHVAQRTAQALEPFS
jgi:glycosyltransferase involved in cell wall biosynthesis